jgi:hypothetical protein
MTPPRRRRREGGGELPMEYVVILAMVATEAVVLMGQLGASLSALLLAGLR